MEILHLTLKKKWFDMVRSGIKKEEYREIKPYWNTRLSKTYDAVLFRNGYQPDPPSFYIELKVIRIGIGIPEWGAPPEPVYILELGDLIKEGD